MHYSRAQGPPSIFVSRSVGAVPLAVPPAVSRIALTCAWPRAFRQTDNFSGAVGRSSQLRNRFSFVQAIHGSRNHVDRTVAPRRATLSKGRLVSGKLPLKVREVIKVPEKAGWRRRR